MILEKDGKILLVRRNKNPYKGTWSLPGGYVEYGETVEQAVERELLEECGLKVKIDKLLGVYSDPKRQPDKHVIAICFAATPIAANSKATSSEGVGSFFAKNSVPPKLAFDHRKMLDDYLLRTGL